MITCAKEDLSNKFKKFVVSMFSVFCLLVCCWRRRRRWQTKLVVRYFYDKGPRIFADVETRGIGSLMQINGCGRLCRCHGAGWRSFVSRRFRYGGRLLMSILYYRRQWLAKLMRLSDLQLLLITIRSEGHFLGVTKSPPW